MSKMSVLIFPQKLKYSKTLGRAEKATLTLPLILTM